MIELLSLSVSDRNLLISSIDSLFKGRNFFAPQPFKNLERVAEKIYDSYLPKSEKVVKEALDFTDFSRIRRITKQYFRQNLPTRNKPSTKSITEPCLEVRLRTHKIWDYEDVWVCLSKDQEDETFAGVKELQVEMEAYNLAPELFEAVTTKLTEGPECENEEVKQSREECIENIAKYYVTFKAKEKVREEEVK